MNTLFSDETISSVMPKKLKEFRKKSGLTIEQVGELLNKTKQAVSTWETGKSIPDVTTLLSLCKLYDVKDFNDFLDNEMTFNFNDLNKNEKQIIKMYRNIPKNLKKTIETILIEFNKRSLNYDESKTKF